MKNYLIFEFDDSNRVERILVDQSFSDRAVNFITALRRPALSRKFTKVNLRDFVLSSLIVK